MDFSIITPNLNYGHFLGECLESVAGQIESSSNLEDLRARRPHSLEVTLEHFVIDGGSTDESAAVAARYPHIKWLQEPDQGMSDAINKGFEQAQGDWVIWLNADDRLKPGALAEMLELLKKSEADVVYGDWNFVNEAGHFLRRVKTPKWCPFVHVHHQCYVASTAAFYRRTSVIEEGYRLRKDFRYVMDGEFYARLSVAGKDFAHVPVVVADFRLHGENLSLRHSGRTREMDKILAAERQHVESRAIRRAYGITLTVDPYLNGLVDGIFWIVARGWKALLRCVTR